MKQVVLVAIAALGYVSPVFAQNPCALLVEQRARQIQSNSSTAFKPSEVYACLQDVPINNTRAVAQIDWLSQIVQFQSTLSYLKNPPQGYQFPPVDIQGGLQRIKQRASSGGYSNEYDFELDIFKLIGSSNDGHFTAKPFLVGAFTYTRNQVLVSVSVNNSSPAVYLSRELTNPNRTYTPSDIVQIDGEDVTQRILRVGAGTGFQDLDAQYNALFYSDPTNAIGGGLGLYAGIITFSQWNDTSIYRFRNGTVRTLPNVSAPRLNLTGITSGQDIYNRYIAPPPTTSSSQPTPSSTTKPDPSATARQLQSIGYPVPVDVSLDNSVGGYFLNRAPDTAVLSVRGFTINGGDAVDFQKTVEYIFNESRKANKSRLIIDLRGNGGGTSYCAYDLFKQLFPALALRQRNQFRYHEASDTIGRAFQDTEPITLAQVDTYRNNLNSSTAPPRAASSELNYRRNLKTPGGQAFSSFREFYPPRRVNGDNFTAIYSFPFDNEAESIFVGGLIVTGYNNRSNPQPAPFAEENITILSDGRCASSCGLLLNLLLSSTKVNSVVMGGRPSVSNIPIIGGVQGSRLFTLQDIQRSAAAALTTFNTSGKGTPADFALLNRLLDDAPLTIQDVGVNFMDNLPVTGDNPTPLQFQRSKEGDCHAWYTPQDIGNVSTTWERIALGKVVCTNSGGGLRGGGASGGRTNAAVSVKGSNALLSLVMLVIGYIALLG